MKEPYSFTFFTASWYRRSPYWQRTVEAGCTSWDLYNHMLIPTLYDDDEREYPHLVEHVGLWDVAVERQVEIVGPDAARFTQLLTCRDLCQLQRGALSTKQFAQLAGISPESAANACQDGRVPGALKVRVTAQTSMWRIPVTEVVVSLLNKYRAQRSRPSSPRS